jgi:putative phosphonate metabolism protein
MADSTRYAIYFAPSENSPLWRFGSSILGYDAATGQDAPFRPLRGIALERWPELSAEPRLYGFHATLKAPFRLAPGMTRDDLFEALEDMAPRQTTVVLEGLQVTTLGPFLALTPIGDTSELNGLAYRVTSEIDVLRAPLNEAERQKRLKAPLTERQRAQLDRFGYPYVGDDFQFHMTLSGSLPEELRQPVHRALTEAFAEDIPVQTVDVDSLTVFEQRAPSDRFVITERIPLG